MRHAGTAWILAMAIAPAGYGQQMPLAPTGLQCGTATTKQVTIDWKPVMQATGYWVERRSSTTGDWSRPTALPIITLAFTDTEIDPYETYRYRVIATDGKVQSQPSAEIVTGPPPAGFSVAVPVPQINDPAKFGRALQTALDANGDPAVAYYWIDINDDGDLSDSALYFVDWDRAHYQWKPPVQIVLVGDVPHGPGQTPFSLARDAQTGVWGVAFELKHPHAIGLAISNDNGASWSVKELLSDKESEFYSPGLEMASGKFHIALVHGGAIEYITGPEKDPSKFERKVAPAVEKGARVYPSVKLRLDSAGRPGVAYVVSTAEGSAVYFWRPEAGNPVKVADSANFGTDGPHLDLAFAGTQPRIAFYQRRDNPPSHSVWVSVATDSGATWRPPVPIPPDGNGRLAGPSLAINSKGQLALAAEVTGGNDSSGSGQQRCGYPVVSRSSDGVNWTTCSPAGGPKPELAAESPRAIFAPNGKLYVVFYNRSGPKELQGIVVWREP